MEQGPIEFKMLSQVTQNTINQHREQWALIAKKAKWHTKPFHVQAWIHSDGTVFDVVAHKGMTDEKQDMVIVDDNYNDWS